MGKNIYPKHFLKTTFYDELILRRLCANTSTSIFSTKFHFEWIDYNNRWSGSLIELIFIIRWRLTWHVWCMRYFVSIFLCLFQQQKSSMSYILNSVILLVHWAMGTWVCRKGPPCPRAYVICILVVVSYQSICCCSTWI